MCTKVSRFRPLRYTLVHMRLAQLHLIHILWVTQGTSEGA